MNECTADGTSTKHVQVRVILSSILIDFIFPRLYPHEETLGILGTHWLDEVVRDFVGIHEHHPHFLCHRTRRHEVSTMRVDECVALSHFFQFAHTIVVGSHGIGILIELATDNAVHQDRSGTLGTRFVHEFAKIIIEGAAWVGVASRICLFVVVPKLNDDIITCLQFVEHSLPLAIVDKTFGRIAIESVVIHVNAFREEALQHHRPSSLLLVAVDSLVRHRGVADGEDGDAFLFLLRFSGDGLFCFRFFRESLEKAWTPTCCTARGEAQEETCSYNQCFFLHRLIVQLKVISFHPQR